MTDHIANTGKKAFTLVFEGDLKDFKGNPFQTETPFGRPYACGHGNMFEREEEATETITVMEQALRAVRSAWPTGQNRFDQMDALVLVNRAIERAEKY